MKTFLALNCHYPADDMIIELSLKDGEDGFNKGAIYENGLYSISFVYYGDREIKEGEVFIDGQVIAELEADVTTNDRKTMKLIYKTNFGYKDRGYPFLMLLDTIRIKIAVTFEDGEEMLLTSKKILVVTKNAEDRKNISQMIDYIDAGNALKTGIFRDNVRGPQLIYKLNNYLGEVLKFSKIYADSYRDSLYTDSRLKLSAKNRFFGQSFSIGGEDVRSSVSLRESNEFIAFLKLLINRANKIYKGYKELWQNYIKEYKLLEKSVPKDFSAPILTAHNIRSEYAIREASNLYSNLCNLNRILVKMPQIQAVKTVPTPDLPRQKYKNKFLYDIISSWPLGQEEDVVDESFLFRIDSLNKLYEYYCLMRLLKFFKDEGYLPDRYRDESFIYDTKNQIFENERIVLNTYYRKKGDIKLTIYFQPLIYGDRVCNDLSLIRTTGADSNFSMYNKTGNYYSPDFILKMEGNKETYLILDSKFQTRHTILKGHMDQVISKYFTQVRQTNGNRDQKVYILQGRTDSYNNSAWIYENNPLLGDEFLSDFGILQFSPDLPSNSEFRQLLRRMEKDAMKKEP